MKQFDDIDIDVLRRYDKPGPRYTSYPTAPVFSPKFGPDQFREEIIRTNGPEEKSGISLYFHLPFCDTLCYFCGCTMLVTHSRERIAEYNRYLKGEIDLLAPMIAQGRAVEQLQWGGGTPSYLNPDEILGLSRQIRSSFRFADDAEAGVEIDPRGLTRDTITAFREGGFNRISMGVQDFNSKVQEAVNRIQPEAMTREVIDWSRSEGFSSINLYLIYGLPFQTLESFGDTVDRIIDISPDRIAVFNFAYVPWLKPHQRLIRENGLPTPEEKLHILKMTIEKLTAAGYWYIGMDHFAKPDDELAIAQKTKTMSRNFQGYSTKAGCDVYAFGMSSISQLHDSYAQNAKTLPEYYGAVNARTLPTHVGYRLTEDDQIRRHVIMRLMCDMELDRPSVERQFGIEFDSYFADSLGKLTEFIEGGFLADTGDRLVIQGMGRLILRNIVMAFDAYYEKMMKEKPVFSRTV